LKRDRLKLIAYIFIAISISGFLTSIFIIGYIELASAFAGWILASIVLAIIASSRGAFSNPESLIGSYRYIIRQILEEFNIHDKKPYFTPSSISGNPSMLIPIKINPGISKIPKRMIILKEARGVRLETLGSYVLNELGGVGEGLSSSEDMIKSVLTSYLEIAKDIKIVETGEHTIIVKISKYIREYIGEDPPSVNIYLQIIGPIISESLNRVLRFEDINYDGNNMIIKFSIMGV